MRASDLVATVGLERFCAWPRQPVRDSPIPQTRANSLRRVGGSRIGRHAVGEAPGACGEAARRSLTGGRGRPRARAAAVQPVKSSGMRARPPAPEPFTSAVRADAPAGWGYPEAREGLT